MKVSVIRIAIVALVPVCFVYSVVGTAGVVLCMSECGHTAVETEHDVSASCCLDVHANEDMACESDGECIDISFDMDAVIRSTSDNHLSLIAHPAVASDSYHLPSMPVPLAGSPFLAHSQTGPPVTVLRI